MNIAFIPVRSGSKGIVNKNIKLFLGKPLLFWITSELEKTPLVHKVVIATDSDEIRQIALSFGFSKVEIYERLEANAQDKSSTESVMQEYISYANLELTDNFILAQVTSPFTQSTDFTEALNMLSNEEFDSVLSCARVKRFFWNESGESINYDFKSRPRRQEFEGALVENGAFYINSVGNIILNQNRLSGKIGIYEMPEYTSVEIDEPEDWIVAEALMSRLRPIMQNSKCPIKLFVSDVDGVLTDSGMYYSNAGDELKKFHTHDGMAFQILRECGIKTAIVTSENTKIVSRRADKLKVDYLYQGKKHQDKLHSVQDICNKEGIDLTEVAYIGDDINCYELLSAVGVAACPNDATEKIKSIPNIIRLSKNGGEGVVREFVSVLGC